MKVEVDQSKCRTAGMCVKKCPEVFRFQEGSKRAIALLHKIPTSLQEKCRQAMKACPNNAISVEE